jgi:hypothetical protein
VAVTGRDLVSAALSRAGVLVQGEALTADDLTVALASLNQMLDEWSLERLMIYGTYVDTLVMTPNVAAYSSSQLASGQRPAAKPLAMLRATSAIPGRQDRIIRLPKRRYGQKQIVILCGFRHKTRKSVKVCYFCAQSLKGACRALN